MNNWLILFIVVSLIFLLRSIILDFKNTKSPEERIIDALRGMESLTRVKTREEEEEEENNRDRNTYV